MRNSGWRNVLVHFKRNNPVIASINCHLCAKRKRGPIGAFHFVIKRERSKRWPMAIRREMNEWKLLTIHGLAYHHFDLDRQKQLNAISPSFRFDSIFWKQKIIWNGWTVRNCELLLFFFFLLEFQRIKTMVNPVKLALSL